MYFTLKDENARIAAVMFAGIIVILNSDLKMDEGTREGENLCLRGEWFLSNLYSRHAT